MMEIEKILQLFPPSGKVHELKGLYLSQDIRSRASEDRPYVYSNYVTSLDGRIAVPHPSRPGLVVPKSIANDRDWRLFQELAIQADILFTSGRYLRDYADGRAQEILRVYDDPRFEDLTAWRKSRSLSPQPDLAVISASLSFPIPEALTTGGRKVIVITIEDADPERLRALEGKAEIIFAGKEKVGGQEMVSALHTAGYRILYNATGPKVLHLLLAAGMLDRLYLTFASRILGGKPYSTIVDGDLLLPPADFRLSTLFHDSAGVDGLGQLFAAYDSA